MDLGRANIGTGYTEKIVMAFICLFSLHMIFTCGVLPPALDDVAMEILRQSWNLRPELYHVFVVKIDGL